MIDIGELKGTIRVHGGEEAVKSFETLQDKVAKTGEAIKKFAMATGAILGASLVKAVSSATELQKACNKLQSQTGATDTEMKGLHDTLKSIYANNYGESYEDIADSLASVQQQTNLTGNELQKATENALALRDTFDWEVDESIRAVDMMMTQFGITSEQAYNLIAQGAQNGLDKNDNLLDSINEYSVHFQQLGLDAEDMFNMMQNGAEQGVFDYDKLGDAVKEFGIRAKDSSDSTKEAFAQLGLDADKMTQAFGKGGTEAEKAFQQVMSTLAECDDKVLQNQIGVALFGTMWEDMGADAVLALTNVNGTMDMTKNSMEQINQIRYDDLGSAFEGIKRQLETGVLIPIGEQLLPKLTEFSQWISDNMPTIQETVNNVFGGLGVIIEGLCNNFDTLIPILAGVVSGFVAFEVITTVQSAITTLTPIVTALTTAMGTGGLVGAIGAIVNPVGLAVTAIGALVAIIVSLYQNNEDVRNMLNGCWESIKECFSSACEFIQSVIQKFIDVGTAIWNKYGDSISEIFNATWELVISIIKTAIDLITDIFNVFSKAFQGDWKGCWEAVKKLVSDVWNNICDIIGKYLDLVITTIVNIGVSLFKAGQNAFNQLKKGVTEVWETLMEWFGKVVENPVETITNIGSGLFNAGKEIIGQLLNGLKNMWQNIENWFIEKVNWISDKLKFWEDSQSKMSESSSGKTDGSHRNGLANVPFDGYRAELHKGEMVLTQAQADRYRNTQAQSTVVQNNFDTTTIESKLDQLTKTVSDIVRKQQIAKNMA